MKRWLLRLPPATYTIIVLLAIAYLTLVPQPLPDNDLELFPGVDKVVHGIMFGALAFAMAFDLRRHSDRSLSRTRLAVIAVASTLIGMVIEVLQAFCIPGRSGDGSDLIGDAIGAVLAVVVFNYCYNHIFTEKNK